MIKCENDGSVTANGTLGDLLSEYGCITHSLYKAFSKNLGKEKASEYLTIAFEEGKALDDQRGRDGQTGTNAGRADPAAIEPTGGSSY